MVAGGVPLDLEAIIETHAKYRDLPELRTWFSGMLPEYRAAQEQNQLSHSSPPRANVGEYVRRNVSEQTNSGGLLQNLTQAVASDNPSVIR
jgi:hypothetical protein